MKNSLTYIRCLAILFFAVVIALVPSTTFAKNPAWGVDEHPRLLASAAEKSSIIAKLTAPNTVSNKVWSDFLVSYRKLGQNHDYADGAFLYWINGDTAAADAAIANAQTFITQYPDGYAPDVIALGDYPTDYWRYHSLLLTYDFAYTRLTPTQKIQFRNFIARQGVICYANGPSWAPGNIHAAIVLCALGSAVVLEGYDASKDIVNEAIVRGNVANGGDKLYYPSDASNFVVSSQPGGAGTVYTQGVDFNYVWLASCGNQRCIDWSPTASGAKEPSAGSSYYVSYHWTANLDAWKNEGRKGFENHLSYQWHDGIYNGGINPYGNLAASYLPYFVEIFKRDLGIDYSRNNDLKKVVDPFLYERLPMPQRRFNTLNDSTSFYSGSGDALIYPSTFGYRPWMRHVIAWATSAYANDPDGYGQKALWLWEDAYRLAGGAITYYGDADWREALWFNDSLAGTYPNLTVPQPNWPKQRYFRGKEVVYVRNGTWGVADTTSLVASFVTGVHNHQSEHDQGDAGSFTFFNNGEDWAIDPGYQDAASAGGGIVDHNGLGLDGHGYDASGAYGAPGTTPQYGGFSHFDSVALSDSASVLKAELTGAWTLSDTPYVDHHQRYFALVSGDKPTYMIVADDIRKDNSNHSFQWYLHTGPNNAIATTATKATVTGWKTGSTMLVQPLSPLGTSQSVATVNNSAIGQRQRLVVAATGVQNPNFLVALIPTTSGQTAPTVTRNDLGNGVQATVTWADGTIDTILWRTGVGNISAAGIVSDAKLTIVRVLNNTVTGLIVSDGRSVSFNGQTILSVADGVKPVSVAAFGASSAVAAEDASILSLKIPGISSVNIEDGPTKAPFTLINSVATINTPYSLGEMRRGAGLRYQENFNDNYANGFYRYNRDVGSADRFLVKNGALELSQPGAVDWMTITKRDTSFRRREDVYPTVIPPFEHGDATVNFKFKFTQLTSATRKLRFYFRTKYRDTTDWAVNEDYLRLELNAQESGVVKNLLSLGQRYNGDLVHAENNDFITHPITSAAAVINNTDWHQIAITATGSHVKVSIDGNQIADADIPIAVPTSNASGFLQWSVVGSDPVLIDDLEVRAIKTKTLDTLAPAKVTGLKVN